MSRLASLIIVIALVLLSACDKQDELQVPQFVSRQADNFVLNNGHATLTVSPAKGGRVVGLTMNGFELLAVEKKGNDQISSFGSVLWSSPQSEWSWPPLLEHNTKPFSVGCDKDRTAIILTSEIEPKTGYQLVKSYSIGTKAETFAITYKIINHSDKEKWVAAIENTRVLPEGLVFFPKGDTEPSGGIFYPLQIEVLNDIVWHKFEPEKIRQDHHKVMMDGKEGWLAYLRNEYLFVQRFIDVAPDRVPDTEREIEIFGHADRIFAELKHQSALHFLKPGESFEWEVEWQVKKLADEIDLQIGSQDLLNAVREH
jgi:hypothetical protein